MRALFHKAAARPCLNQRLESEIECCGLSPPHRVDRPIRGLLHQVSSVLVPSDHEASKDASLLWEADLPIYDGVNEKNQKSPARSV